MNGCCTGKRHHPHFDLSFSAGRRRFIQLAGLGAGAAMFLGRSPMSHASGNAEALLLSCMDYRLVDDLVRYMDQRGLTNRYDHVILAGASAAVMHDKFKNWQETFWTHLQAAIDLHKIRRVIAIDHRDCGAYKMAFGAEHAADAEVELAVHSVVLGKLAAAIRQKHPAIAVETHLMALDGSVTTVGTSVCQPPVQDSKLESSQAQEAVAAAETDTHAN